MKEKYYITTAIAYTSTKPHIGNTYEIILADSIARYKRQKGFDVIFQTGTDEHGQKIELKAQENGFEPQEYVDKIAKEVKDIWDIVNTSYDRFIRTTDPKHEAKVQRIFKKLYDQGDIYKGEYTGLYCTPCESFFTESQLFDNKCPDCGREVQPAAEECYFLKLSKYQKQLEEHIENNPEFIQPESRKNEILNNFIKPGLQDLCVSRASFKWGVPVDFDPNHVVYVWIDALSNYITFAGYDVDFKTEEYKKYWPADLHLIGKDIVRFHTIYWPVILMALKESLPKQVFGHPWLLSGNDKMSKSKGNIMYADDLVNLFGVDAVRYYVLHEIPFANDGIITYDLIIERINSDLANVLGNLVNRSIAMANKYFDGKIENKEILEEGDKELIKEINNLNVKIEDKMSRLEIGSSLDEIFNMLRKSNKYVDETTPWVLAKDESKKDRLETVIYNLLESIRVCAYQLRPFIPQTSEEIFKQLNINDNSETFNSKNSYQTDTPTPLFQRIDLEEKLKEINKN